MIVNISGTSGAGKTTLAKALLAQSLRAPEPTRVEGRKRPMGMTFWLPTTERPVHIVGDYEDGLLTCGCDTIKDVELVHRVILEHHEAGEHVVYEGLFVMNHTRGPQLVRAAGKQLTVLLLTTTLVDCIASVNARRAASTGTPKPVNWDNVKINHKRAINFAYKMGGWGAIVHKVDRQEAMPLLLGALT